MALTVTGGNGGWFLPCDLDLRIILPRIWEMMQEEEKQSRGSPVTRGACVMLPASLGKENIPCAGKSRQRVQSEEPAADRQHRAQSHSCSPSLSRFHPEFHLWGVQHWQEQQARAVLVVGSFVPNYLRYGYLHQTLLQLLVSPVSCYSNNLGHHFLSYLILGISLHTTAALNNIY